MLPIDAKDRELGKWFPNLEGPFKVHQVLLGNAYWLSSLDGESHKMVHQWVLSHNVGNAGYCQKKLGNEEITSKNRSH